MPVYQHRTSDSGHCESWRRAASAILAMLICTASAAAQDSKVPGEKGYRPLLHTSCDRPFPPEPELYETEREYIAARELYYKEAAAYVSVCLNGWIMEARQRYEEMFRAEADGYNAERQVIFDEIRSAASRKYRKP